MRTAGSDRLWSTAIAIVLTMAAGAFIHASSRQNVVTDGWITMKIHSQYVPEDVLEGSNIDVDTAKGVVTLTGVVPTAAARTRALAIAKATDGVKSVVDKLRIGPAESALE